MRSKEFIILLFVFLSGCYYRLYAQNRPALIVPTGHSGAIIEMVFSPSADMIYSLGSDGQLKSWETGSGKMIRSLQVFMGSVKNIEHASLCVSPSGLKAVVTENLMGKGWLIDLVSFQIEKELNNVHPGTAGVAFRNDGNGIYLANMTALILTNPDGSEKQKWFSRSIDSVSAGAPFIRAMSVSPDGELIAVGFSSPRSNASDENAVSVLSTVTGRVLKKFVTGNPFISSMIFSPDGKSLFVNDDRLLSRFNISNGDRKSVRSTGRSLLFIDERKNDIVACTKDGWMYKYNQDNLQEDGSDKLGIDGYSNSLTAVLYQKSNGLLFRAVKIINTDRTESATIQACDMENKTVVKSFDPESASTGALAFSPDGNYLLIGSADDKARVWDLKNGGVNRMVNLSPKWNPYVKMYVKSAAFAPDGSMFALNTYYGVAVYPMSGGDSLAVTFNMADAIAFLGNTSRLAIAGSGSLNLFQLKYDTAVKAKQIWTAGLANPAICVRQATGSRLFVTTKSGFFLTDTANLQVINSYRSGLYPVRSAAYLPEMHFVLLGGGLGEGDWNIIDDRDSRVIYKSRFHKDQINNIQIAPKKRLAALSSKDHTTSVWKLDNPENPVMLFQLRGHEDAVISSAFSFDEKLLATGSEDKTCRIWSTETGKEIVTLIALGSEWLMVTPDGYYFASPKGARLIHFVKENHVYYFDQYDLIFNRPDIVLTRLGIASPHTIDSYRKAFELRRESMKLGSEDTEPAYSTAPDLSIVNTRILPRANNQSMASLTLRASADTGQTLKRVMLKINGVPLYGEKGLVLENGKNILEKSFDIPLSSGVNEIEVSVMDTKGIWSIEQHRDIYNPAHNRPSLYIISIGISNYKARRMNLKYAAKDATDIAVNLQTLRSKFEDVHTYTLVDSEVTLSRVRALKKKLLPANPDDEVILFYAGHGQLSNGVYYLSSYDQDFDHPERTGLQYRELENIMDSIPARQKIIFLDACHSGEAYATSKPRHITPGLPGTRAGKSEDIDSDKQVTFDLMKTLFNDLRNSSGTTVFASASAREYAWEDDSKMNGLFTYALLHSINNPKADLDNNGIESLSEWLKFIKQEVIKLSAGSQTPTLRVENLSHDFSVF